MPTSTETKPLRGPAAAVDRALTATEPIVHMWRDGLTVIALASGLRDRPPDYLTFDQATAEGGIGVKEASIQTVPTVEAVVGPAPVLVLGGDTIIGGAQNRIINVSILLKAAAATAHPCLMPRDWPMELGSRLPRVPPG